MRLSLLSISFSPIQVTMKEGNSKPEPDGSFDTFILFVSVGPMSNESTMVRLVRRREQEEGIKKKGGKVKDEGVE